MQMELAYWPAGCVRAVLNDYVTMRAESCAVETIQEDYRYRVDWLLHVFGELTPASAVSYDMLEAAARAGRRCLLQCPARCGLLELRRQ